VKTLTHEERLELIYRPFFIVNIGSSYPWGGVAVIDHFYSDGRPATRPRPNEDNRHYSNILMGVAAQATA
jgi:hypothetical protein